jgi:predicted nucleotide-binding protein
LTRSGKKLPEDALPSDESVKREPSSDGSSVSRRARLHQSDVPAYSLSDALRVPKVLRDEYGKQPTRPLMVAKAMQTTPASTTFRMLTGAAVAYNLTDGAAQADQIGLTTLGRRIVAPTTDGDDRAAMCEAVLVPRIVNQFLTKYDGSPLPSQAVALNVLEEMGVPSQAAQRALDMILVNARDVGFIEEVGGKNYVDLERSRTAVAVHSPDAIQLPPGSADENGSFYDIAPVGANEGADAASVTVSSAENTLANNRRVFVSHGKNRYIVDQLKELLTFGKFDPIVSMDNEATAKPVPAKVMDDMRSCGAGIVHVGTELTLLDDKGNQHKMLNPNVLIEIGAAMALYRGNFILLVEQDVEFPSNLQGLYQVRYSGERLDYEATMKLLKAFNEFSAAQ